jgi:hypothetical protein
MYEAGKTTWELELATMRRQLQRKNEQDEAADDASWKVRTPLFVRAPRCPCCGMAMMELYAGVRGAWRDRIGRFNCRRGYEMVYVVRDGRWAADPDSV